MSEENRLIIEQLNKFGRVLQTSELLKMIEDLEKEKTMYKTSFEEMSKNYFELQQESEQLKKELKKQNEELYNVVCRLLDIFDKNINNIECTDEECYFIDYYMNKHNALRTLREETIGYE